MCGAGRRRRTACECPRARRGTGRPAPNADHPGGLHRHVRTLGQRAHRRQVFEYARRSCHGLRPAWSITSLRPGCSAAMPSIAVERAGHEHHQGNTVALGRGPQPIRRAVGQQLPVVLVVEREAHAEHARLLLPARYASRLAGSSSGGVPSRRSDPDTDVPLPKRDRCARPPRRAARARPGSPPPGPSRKAASPC